MDKRYKHFCSEERGVILAEHRRGSSLREIGLVIGGATRTFGRELARGWLGDAPYDPQVARLGSGCATAFVQAARQAGSGRPVARLGSRQTGASALAARTERGRLRVLHPGDPTARVSHETIHAAICAQPKGGLKAAMVLALQQAKPARGLRRTTPAGSPMAPESLRIIHLPQEIEARLIPGLCGMRRVFGNAGSGSTTSRRTRICETTSNIAGSIPSNTAWWMTPRIGPIPPITATTRWVRFHPTEK